MTGFRLIPDPISHEVIEAATQLLDGAQSGEIVGMAFIVMLTGRKFFTNVAGGCRSDPHLTRGMLLALDDELRNIIGDEREHTASSGNP